MTDVVLTLAVATMPAILSTEATTPSAPPGWTLRPADAGAETPVGGWEAGAPGAMATGNGIWESPPFAVTPHRYYRLAFQAKGEAGYVFAAFFDATGNPLEADASLGVDPARDWSSQELCFQAKAGAATARLRFQPLVPGPTVTLRVRNVALAEASGAQVLDWADRLYATLPPVAYDPPSNRWDRIPRTLRKLRQGEPVRIIILGDSIGNDTGNAPLDLLIQRRHPGSRVELITSVRGGKGCPYYREAGRVGEYVARHRPDLVMIIAISHDYNLPAIRDVIRQIRVTGPAEILLTTAPIAPDRVLAEKLAQGQRLPLAKAAERRARFLAGVEALAERECVAFVPLRKLWNAYIAFAAPAHDEAWFLRDSIHANCRGGQVVARMLEAWFAPADGPVNGVSAGAGPRSAAR